MSQLPSTLTNLAQGLADSARDVGVSSNALYMKFAKGVWEFGAENQEVESDSEWVIHPEGFMHGWIAWGSKETGNEGEMLGEVFTPATTPSKAEIDLPEVNGSWAKQVGIQMLCVAGADEGVTVLFKASSHGGKKMYSKVLEAVVKKIHAGDDLCCPVVTLGSESYKHKTYGRIHNPTFEVIDFMTLEELKEIADSAQPQAVLEQDGEDVQALDEAAVAEVEKEEPKQEAKAEKPKRSRRTAKKAEEPAPEKEEVETQAPSRRRRARRA